MNLQGIVEFLVENGVSAVIALVAGLVGGRISFQIEEKRRLDQLAGELQSLIERTLYQDARFLSERHRFPTVSEVTSSDPHGPNGSQVFGFMLILLGKLGGKRYGGIATPLMDELREALRKGCAGKVDGQKLVDAYNAIALIRNLKPMEKVFVENSD